MHLSVLKRRLVPVVALLALVAPQAVMSSAHATTSKVLILSTSVHSVGGGASMEQTAANNLGFTADVVTPAQWSALTAADFSSYAAIILGDPNCGTSQTLNSNIGAAESSVGTWAPAISGNVVVIGTDPVFHASAGKPEATTMINSGIAFATADPTFTGAYIDLSCYYESASPNTSVPVLGGFGTFTVEGAGCNDGVHVVAPTHPAMSGLDDAGLSGWNCSIHEVFDSQGPGFTTLAVDQSVGDGVPYILARGPVGTVTNANLTADRPSIAAPSSVPLFTIPLTKVPGLTSAMSQAQLGRIKMDSTPISAIPISAIPISAIGLDSIDPHEFDGVLLSSIALDWTTILKNTKFEGLALQTISLGDVLADPTAKQQFDTATQHATLGQFGFARSLLRGTSVVSALLGSAPISAIPVPQGATSWCALFARYGYTCAPGTDETKESMLGFDVQGAPISAIPISAIPISAIPRLGPISAIPISAIPLVGKLGKILISSLRNPGAVVDCSKIDCSQAGGKTLHDALAANAIMPGATINDLDGAFGDVTIGDVLVELLSNSDYPWENMSVGDILAVANGPAVGYMASYDIACVAGIDITTNVTAPVGFTYVPGSAAFSYDGSTSRTPMDPTIAGQGLSWHGIPGSPCGSGVASKSPGSGVHNVHLSYAMRPSATLGTYTSTLDVVENSAETRKNEAAPVAVIDGTEPDNTPATARPIELDTLELGHIAHTGDEAFFTVPAPRGRAHMFVSMFHVPQNQDYDLMAYEPQQAPLQSSPISAIPISAIPAQDQGSDVHGGIDGRQAPETTNDVPVSAEPGLGDPAAVSAGRGNVNEKIDLVTSGVQGNITIRVTGYNGSYSSDPFVLRVWTNGPPPLPPAPARMLPNDSDPWHGSDEAATTGTLPASIAPDTQSLFIVNKDRMMDQFGQSSVNDMLTNLNAVAARPDVKGAVLSVDGSSDFRGAFEAWDGNPNSVTAANDVVRAINNVVNAYRPTLTTLKHIVLLGTDEAIPFARVTDGTTLSNEIDEAHDMSFTTKGLTASNATYASVAQGQILTDDAYGTFTKIKWLDHDLSLPDVSVARLVETPSDISNQLAAFVAANGIIDPHSALVTGYDFLSGGASQVASQLRAKVGATNVAEMNNDTWSRADLLAAFTNATPPPDIASVNAHYAHNLAEPANTPDRTGLVSTQDVPAPPATGAPAFANRLLFTVGCHAGLNVADTLIPNPTADEQKLLKDWAQTWSGQTAALYLANTGFGYGDSETVALSARLAALFARHLNDNWRSVGEMVVQAKHDYFESAGNYGPYDEKALIEMTMYGLPFWHTGVGTAPTPPPPPATTTDPVTGLQTASVAFTPTLARHDTTRGTYWSGDQGVHTIQYRPVLPLETQSVTNPGTSAHGALITALTTSDVPIANPYLFHPTIDSSSHEPATGTDNQVYPANVLTVERSRSFGQESATLDLIAAQYRGGQGSGGSNVMRLITSATTSLAYDSSSASFDPPTIQEFHVTQLGPTTVRIFGRASDSSGVKRFAALYHLLSSNTWSYVELTAIPNTDGWAATVTLANADQLEAIGQAQDAHGNVTRTTNKGLLYPATTDTAPPDVQINTPAVGISYPMGSTVNASYFCSDANSGISSCSGDAAMGAPIDTSSIGYKTFHATATNGAGLSATVTVHYFVGNALPTTPADTTPPQSQFGAGRDVLIEAGLVNDGVSGHTIDDQSGVAGVTVTYTPTLGGQAFSTQPALLCTADRLACAWTARAPIVPGRYVIRAVATDRAGNVESKGPERTVTIL